MPWRESSYNSYGIGVISIVTDICTIFGVPYLMEDEVLAQLNNATKINIAKIIYGIIALSLLIDIFLIVGTAKKIAGLLLPYVLMIALVFIFTLFSTFFVETVMEGFSTFLRLAFCVYAFLTIPKIYTRIKQEGRNNHREAVPTADIELIEATQQL